MWPTGLKTKFEKQCIKKKHTITVQTVFIVVFTVSKNTGDIVFRGCISSVHMDIEFSEIYFLSC